MPRRSVGAHAIGDPSPPTARPAPRNRRLGRMRTVEVFAGATQQGRAKMALPARAHSREPGHPVSNREAIDLMVKVALRASRAPTCVSRTSIQPSSRKSCRSCEMRPTGLTSRYPTDAAGVDPPSSWASVNGEAYWRGPDADARISRRWVRPAPLLLRVATMAGEAAARGLVTEAPGTQIAGAHTPPCRGTACPARRAPAINPENTPLSPAWVDIGGPARKSTGS